MAVRELAEKVILQSIEDLWDKEQQDSCSAFFSGEDFSLWADVAGMTVADRRKILSMVLESIAKSKVFVHEIHI